MCKLCENTDFLVSALHNISKIDSDKNKLVESIVCDTNSLMCMHGKCVDCENIKLETVESQLDEVEWCEWQNKVETRKIKVGKREEIKEVKITVKEKVKGSISQLIEQTEMQLDRYRKHMFTIKKQFHYYKKKKESLGKNECLMQVDFSENYICKLSSEIHSMHFGASKKQLSLQTGVYFIGQNSKPFTFCTVSENLHHGPGGVWGHLRPILKKIRELHPEVTSLHVFSDGPTTQYKQKQNFYLLSTEPKKLGFNNTSWNFFASGHGKGIPDGVGGAVKRNADREVRFGSDISSAISFVDCMKKSQVDVILISNEAILNQQKKLEEIQLTPIPGTMGLHQIFVSADSPSDFYYRAISCFCRGSNVCEGHQLKHAVIIPKLTTFETVPDEVYFENSLFEMDVDAMEILPNDIPDDRILYPCIVKADGNCLPSSGSVFSHGHINATAELRVRILSELVL
ncbi:hypothetical protein SNE40_021068 [Patella caerulea]|uniref:Uncharacterized protein n=1 Tax=Patella caerulea TaxID=87958 RepID=A0AAN8J4H7_PATCE